MLYNGKELPTTRPKLQSFWDKALHHFPRQATFWDSVIKKYPSWRSSQLAWTEIAEPLSDNIEQLQSIISNDITANDVILTTATHGPFFAVQTQNVHLYDISPIQLQKSLVNFPNALSYWFCDVFHPSMFSEMLTQTQPTVLYLSNIPDYGTHKQLTQLFQKLHQAPRLREILCSTQCIWGEPSSIVFGYLAKLTKNVGYRCQEYSVNDTQALFRISRP